MKQFIIIPVTESNDMSGYSAIAIEFTEANIAEIRRLQNVLDNVISLDNKISEIGYCFVPFDVELFNDDFDSHGELVHAVSDEDIETYRESRESAVEAPSLLVSETGLRISFASKYADGEVYGSLEYKELEQLISKNFKEYLFGK